MNAADGILLGVLIGLVIAGAIQYVVPRLDRGAA